MKYVARDLGESAENSSGGGGRGLLREIAVLSALSIGVIGLLYCLVGWLTDFAVARISPEKEAAFFADYLVSEFSAPVPEALETQWQQAEAILAKLQEAPGVPPLVYQLSYISDPNPNAFAVPGGRIVLTRGLLESLDEEIAVAFVLSHELGHFAGRDHLQRFGRQLGFGASMSLLFGGSSVGVSDSVTNLLALNYSRDDEVAADRFALQLLDAVYGTRAGAERLFEILEQQDTLPHWAYMFQTHPDTAKRIQEIQSQ